MVATLILAEEFKMKRTVFLLVAIFSLLFFSCTKEEFSPLIEDQEGAEGAVMEVTCSIPDYEFVDTKATIGQSGSFAWSTGDQMSMWPSVSAVYSGTPQAVIFKVKQGGSKTATLVGNGWGLLRGQKYYASFPYNSSNTYSKVSINYAGLNQVSNGSTSHLGARDYQHAVTTVPAQGNASVNFSRISSIVKFVITVPENRANVKYTKLTLSADEDIFSSAASYNPSADEVVLTSTKVNQISMTLNGTTGFTPTDGVLTLYVIMAPADWAGKNIKLSLRDEYSYSYSGSFTPSKNQSSGSAGTLNMSVELQEGLSLPYELVDMGLSVLWTTANYGADAPSEYGSYRDGEDDICDGDLIDDIYDTYGSAVKYQVPTDAQFDELVRNCVVTTTTLNGVKVLQFTSKKNNAVLYLPAAGYEYYYSGWKKQGVGTEFAYWTSTQRSPYDLFYFDGDDANNTMWDVDDDYVAMPVRLIWSGDSPATDVLTDFALNPTSLVISEGEISPITGVFTPSGVTDKSIIWTTSDSSVATVDSDGNVTAVSSGIATITAKTNNGGYTATCEVTVKPMELSISIDQSSLNLKLYNTASLSVSVTPSSASGQGIVWSSSNTYIAQVSQEGEVYGYNTGRAIITATIESTDQSVDCIVNVVPNITIQQESIVDLGLSVKWLSHNLGASLPYASGYYLSWGELFSKDSYTSSNYLWMTDDNKLSKYNNLTSQGPVDGITVLELVDDAANAILGGNWHIPTVDEWTELKNNCTWTWTTSNGVNGYLITSNVAGYTDKSIFLPACGQKYGSSLSYNGTYGYYWSSSLYTKGPSNAYMMSFGSNSAFINSKDYYSRYDGLSIRPVTK